jgi:hypothetical protein
VMKMVGLDHVIDYVIQRIGYLEKVYLVGKLARGQDSNMVDLVLIGNIDTLFLLELIAKAEKKINKKIRYIIYTPEEFDLSRIREPGMHPLLLWSK